MDKIRLIFVEHSQEGRWLAQTDARYVPRKGEKVAISNQVFDITGVYWEFGPKPTVKLIVEQLHKER